MSAFGIGMWTWVEWSAGGGVLVLGVCVLLAAYWWCIRSRPRELTPPGASPGPFPAPPLNLRPAQLRYALEVRVEGLDVLATLLDLAVRGLVSIRVRPPEHGTGTDFEVRTAAPAQGTPLQPFEVTVVEDLCGGGRTAPAREAVENELLATDLEAALREDAIRRGWLPPGRLAQQDAWRVAGLVLLVAGIPSVFLFLLGFLLGPCLLPLPLLGLLALVLGSRLPEITPAGAQIAELAYAYQRDLRGLLRSGDASADPALAAQLLPYAAAFGSEGQWVDWARDAVPSGRTPFEDRDGHPVPAAAVERLLPAFLSYRGHISVDPWHRPYWGPVLTLAGNAVRWGRGTPDIAPLTPP